MKKLLFVVLFLFLTGCSTLPSQTPVPSQSSTQTQPAAPIAKPTATVLPPIAPPTSQPPAATTIPTTSTPDALQKEQAAILPIVSPCDFSDQPISYSPTRTWVLATCLGDDPAGGAITRLARMDGSQQWSLSLAETFIQPYNREGADLQKSFFPVWWTKNEDFVYLAVQTPGENTPYPGADGLFLLNLATGKSRPILNPAIAPETSSYALKFSPGGIRLAYIDQTVTPLTIVFYETRSAEETRVPLNEKFNQGGSLLWSSDGKQLFVSLSAADQEGDSSLFVYDLETQETNLVIQQSAGTYLPVDWLDGTTIYAQNYPQGWVYLDLTTKIVRPAPAPILATAAQLLASNLGPQPAEASTLPTAVTDAAGVSMRLVPAGEFVMGASADDALAECMKFKADCQLTKFTDQEAPHVVYLDSYYMDVYEVTNALYKACVDAGACDQPAETKMLKGINYYGNRNYDNYPVIEVTWEQSKNYCEWRGMRLPTEAEWEKAARGIDGRTYPWGEKLDNSFANYASRFGTTSPVDKYESGKSPYGMYDMAGNVLEWVADWYAPDYYQNSPARNPLGPDSGDARVLRGGDWRKDGSLLSVSSREKVTPDYEDFNIGFRCAGMP